MLNVEDGSGADDSESYLSVGDFKAAATALGFDASGYSDTLIEAALRRATRYLDGKYRSRWMGTRKNGRLQALAWPRTDVQDIDGNDVKDDELPAELLQAMAEVTQRELADPGSLTPDTTGRVVISETVGPISTTYAQSSEATAARPIMIVVDELLAGLLSSEGSTNVKFLYRA